MAKESEKKKKWKTSTGPGSKDRNSCWWLMTWTGTQAKEIIKIKRNIFQSLYNLLYELAWLRFTRFLLKSTRKNGLISSLIKKLLHILVGNYYLFNMDTFYQVSSDIHTKEWTHTVTTKKTPSYLGWELLFIQYSWYFFKYK